MGKYSEKITNIVKDYETEKDTFSNVYYIVKLEGLKTLKTDLTALKTSECYYLIHPPTEKKQSVQRLIFEFCRKYPKASSVKINIIDTNISCWLYVNYLLKNSKNPVLTKGEYKTSTEVKYSEINNFY